MPVASLMSASRFSTWAWIDTSSAATDSSRMRIFGSAASARAIATRCRCPPDSDLGGTDRCRSSRPTSPAALGGQPVVDAEHLVDRHLRAVPRVEAGVRVLEDDLHLAAAPPALACR